jgi:hypothetical protein
MDADIKRLLEGVANAGRWAVWNGVFEKSCMKPLGGREGWDAKGVLRVPAGE